jgi:hypothetical protein
MSGSGANPFDDTQGNAEPSWMAPPAPAPSPAAFSGAVATQSAAPAGSYAPSPNPNKDAKMWGISGEKMVFILRAIHISVGIFIVFSAIWAFDQKGSDLEDSTVIAALYTIFLGTILAFSEMRIPKFDTWVRANFGFLYGFKGKAAFLIFVCVFPMSLGTVGIIAGCSAIGACCFDVVVIFKHPYFKSAKSAADQSAYIPPSNV